MKSKIKWKLEVSFDGENFWVGDITLFDNFGVGSTLRNAMLDYVESFYHTRNHILNLSDDIMSKESKKMKLNYLKTKGKGKRK